MPAPPTFIAYKSTSTKIGDDLFVSLTDVSKDDLIIAFSGGFPGATGQPIFIEDDGDNDWQLGYDCGHFFTTKVWYAIAKADGAITIKISSATGYATRAAAFNYRGNIPPFAEPAFPLGYYTPSDVADYPKGVGTAPASLADSFIVTVMCTTAVSDTTGLVASDSGDTARNLGGIPDPVMWAFDRSEAAADYTGGSTITKLKGSTSAFSSFPMISLVFSQPLVETDPTRDRQYQIKSGSGFDHYNPAAFAVCGPEDVPETNRPLIISLAYRPIVDPLTHKKAMITVGVTPDQEVDADGIVVEDDYGNTYTRLVYSVGQDGQIAVAIFQTIISDTAKLPVLGHVFQIRLRISPQHITDAPYQHTAIGVAERTILVAPTPIVTADWKQCDNLSPTVKIVSNVITSVPIGTYMFYFAGYPAGVGQDSIDWSQPSGYFGVNAGFINYTGVQANAPRLGPCIMGDQIAPADDDYDAQPQGLIHGTYSKSGSVALIAASLPALPGSLTLVKAIDGGTASESDWTLTATGPDTISGAGGVGPSDVAAGNYVLSESAGPAGYTGSDWVCTGGTQTGPDSVTLVPGDTVVCTITNTFAEPPPPPPPTTGGKTLRYQIPQKRWFPHSYADEIKVHYLDEPDANQPNDQQLLLLKDTAILKAGGNKDDGTDIDTIAQLPSNDGGDQRGQKLYVDSIVDADSVGAADALAVTLLYENATVTGPTYSYTPGASRAQTIQNISSLVALGLHRNIAPRFAWTGGPDGPRVYAYEPAGFVQPYISKFFVTQFITLAFGDWKHTRRLYPALISTADVIFTIKTQDGRSYVTTIPSTGGQFKVQPIMGLANCKDLSFGLELDGQGTDFVIFLGDFLVEVKGWTMPEYLRLAVFNT